jgi:hypothetical protein
VADRDLEKAKDRAKVREEPREGKRLYRENWSKGNQLHENGCLGK